MSEPQGWTWTFGGGPNGPLSVILRHPAAKEPLGGETWRITPDAITNLIESVRVFTEEQGLPLSHSGARALRQELDSWLFKA